jgi:SAM-dependent methyltransferase
MSLKFKSLHSFLVDDYKKKLIVELVKHCTGKVLDIGCGEKPYYKYVKNNVTEYIGLEHPETVNNREQIDIFGSADNLPFPENSFDTVMLIQVLEHVEEPQVILNEISRVLKPEGKLIFAVPFIYPEHETPRDFYRYTRFGIKYLTSKAGLSTVSLEPVSGFGTTFIYMLSHYLYNKSKLVYIAFIPLFLFLLLMMLIFERFDKNRNSINRWTWNFIGVFKK